MPCGGTIELCRRPEDGHATHKVEVIIGVAAVTAGQSGKTAFISGTGIGGDTNELFQFLSFYNLQHYCRQGTVLGFAILHL